jgi:hypothetical protein
MRVLHASVITLFILLLSTVAAAQMTDRERASRFLKNETVTAPPVDEPKIDRLKIKFLPEETRECRVGSSNKFEVDVVGIVDRKVDLSDDLTAQQTLLMGFAFGREHCTENSLKPDGRPRGFLVQVSLLPGDPATVTEVDARRLLGFHRGERPYPADNVDGLWDSDQPGLIIGYRNYPKALKAARAYDAQEARERNAVLEQRRQREQKVAARWAAFLKANRVKQVVTIDQLTANPFVYEGQVVAISGMFERMNSRTQGIFSAGGYRFVVSGISTARFTRTGSAVVLAGRVLGNIEVKPGSTEVPHLSLVAIYVAN